MAAKASIGRGGAKAVHHKEGIDPGRCATHYGQGIHQRRREWPAPRLRGMARKAGAARPDRPGRPGGRLHNRTSEDNADAHLKRQVMGREVVVAVTNGRLDFGTWERILCQLNG